MQTALIVGAGLGGCLLAIYLARRGYRVEVYERQPDPRRSTRKRQSLNITLCERGLRALERVGLRDEVASWAVPVAGRRIHAVDGQLAYQPYGNAGEVIHSISRSDLNDVLLANAEREPGVTFHFGKKCVGVELEAPAVRLEDANGGANTRAVGDVLFAADGAYSAVRFQLQRTEHFNYSQEYWDQGYKSLRIPPRSDGGSLLGADALHIWPRGTRMLIGFPNSDASTSCSLLLPYRGEASFESLSTPDRVERFFAEWFPDAAPHIPSLSEQFFSQPANSLITIRCRPWSFGGKALLVGDAAHAVLPSHGQGANAAFEDCQVLDACLEKCGGDFAATFAAFEAERRPNMDYMAQLCIEHFVELCQLVGEPDFLKRREIERALSALYPEAYEPLYSMISFSTRSYVEARRVDARQRRVVDEIMARSELAAALDGAAVRDLLVRSATEEA